MTEFTSVGADLAVKDCAVCGPYATSTCRLASTSCPYRDLETKNHDQEG